MAIFHLLARPTRGLFRSFPALFLAVWQPVQAQPLYDFGDPTADEQLLIEYINAARADALAEAERLISTQHPRVASALDQFNVDLNLMRQQFAALTRTSQPLAPNAALTRTARLHSEDMKLNKFQGHTSSANPLPPNQPGFDIGDRIAAQNYPLQQAAENVFASGIDAWYSHAGFNIDWGNGPGGMQTPAGHRNSIHNPAFREIGVGVIEGPEEGNFGPLYVTQNFGLSSLGPFLTGVVFVDLNEDGAYAPGEAVSGVAISSPEISSFSARSATFGGYALPVDSEGSHSLRFEAPNLSIEIPTLVEDGQNIKIDLALGAPDPMLPSVSGPTNPANSGQASFSLTSIDGADRYDWRIHQVSDFEALFNGETLSGLTTATAPGVPLQIETDGSLRYRLAHTGIATLHLTLDASLVPLEGAQLLFDERLGFASDDQTAAVEISTDDGLSWLPLRSLPGKPVSTDPKVPNTPTHQSFVAVELPLTAYLNQIIRLRFAFAFPGGSFYNANDSEAIGWFLDNIRLHNTVQVGAHHLETSNSATGHSFLPARAGQFLLSGRARLYGSLNLPWGPGQLVTFANPLSTNPFWDSRLHPGDWRQPSWLGFINERDFPYFYHFNLGWLYFVSGNTNQGLWMHSPQLGWIWMSQGLWPNFFRLQDNSWYYYLQGTGGQGSLTWFYIYNRPSGEEYQSFALTEG